MPEKKPGQKRDNQVTGNIGLYYVCYQLSKHGWNVMPTARNARGIDIVAYPSDVNAGRYVGIQVKTLSKPQDVGMSEEGLRHNGTIWFVVVLNEGKGEEPTVYCFGDDILDAGTKAENKPVVIETSKAGAYVLYPGTKDRTYRYGDEILPGLGAFPLYPKDDDSDEEPIRQFLASVAEYLCDRITRWENFTYQKNLAFSGTQEDWGRYQAAIAHRYKYAENVDDVVHGVRDNLSNRENLTLLPPGRFLSVTLGDAPKAKYSRDKQALWIFEHNLFVKSTEQTLDCDPEDLLMITAMWYPPFSMMVKRYCGTKTRTELESDGKQLPFPARNDIFHAWEVSLCNFNHVKDYLTTHNIESA